MAWRNIRQLITGDARTPAERIIAPLATPIQGVAVGIAFGEVRPLLHSLLTLLLAIAVTIAFATLLAPVLPLLQPLSRNSQVAARVSPTIVDLLAAAFTGLAGSVAITRRDIGASCRGSRAPSL